VFLPIGVRSSDKMANNLKHLVGKSIHIKLSIAERPITCTVSSVEEAGVWLIGTPLLEIIIQTGVNTAEKNLVVFVPMHKVEWILAAVEHGQS